MNRRMFLRTGLASAAWPSGRRAFLAQEKTSNVLTVPQKGELRLANEALVWRLSWDQRRLKGDGFVNKLTGKEFQFSNGEEIGLTISASRLRLEIPGWKFLLGPDLQPAPPEMEQGLKRGYQLPNQSDEEWGSTENLNLRRLRGVKPTPPPVEYEGYGWFRHWFELPISARGNDIVFVLGGYDCQDWNEYWIYLNGVEIGHSTGDGRWRTPGTYSLPAGSPEHRSLRFGTGERNLLAIRTRGFNKRFGGFEDEVLRKYVYKPILVDQFISVGIPYRHLTDFKIKSIRQPADHRAEIELISPTFPMTALVRYELAGPLRRKVVEIKNEGTVDLLLLDVHLDDVSFNSRNSEGGSGEPILIEGEVFCAVEHPAGLNQGKPGQCRLTHFPGKRLAPGQTYTSLAAVWGVSRKESVLDAFTDYLQAKSPRKKRFISMYDPFGINNQWGWCPTLNDVEMMDGLKVLEQWQKKGVHFDYYVPDWGWVDNSSDLTRFRPECFPRGPRQIVERVNQLGMNFGLWFSVSNAGTSCGDYPPVNASLVPDPDGDRQSSSPVPTYRNGYFAHEKLEGNLCVASEPYFSILKNAILYHIRENHTRLIKLDMGSYYCNSAEHDHLPGKYSTERMLDRLIELSDAARRAAPDVCVVWYWGARSSFFALFGDFIFESGLFMEGSGTSRVPTLFYRDSVILNLDMSTQFAKTIPPINKDSLGVWLADNRWGNFMGEERWREALVMDLGRGSLLFPQLWGDVYRLNPQDIEFLNMMQTLSRKNEPVFLQRRINLGDPWKNEVYGYAYFLRSHGFVFLNNAAYVARKARIPLDSSLGLKENSGRPLSLHTYFPERRKITQPDGSPYRTGETAEIWLRPFEILMVEVLAESDNPSVSELPFRLLGSKEASSMGAPLSLRPLPKAEDWMQMEFADAKRFKASGKKKTVYPFSAKLAGVEGEKVVLAIPIQLRQGERTWNYAPAVVEIVQVVAKLGDQSLRLIPVPDSRQFGNTQSFGSSWVVYNSRLDAKRLGGELQFAVSCYLPEDVHPQIEGWLLTQWWEERSRPISDGFYADSPS
ncbi:MAG: hypothetical protein U0V70_06545 [Terriglobia bacterium]